MTRHPLRLRDDDHDLTVAVVGDLARLELTPHPGTPHDPGTAVVEVSARVLIALLRAAWADEHGGDGRHRRWAGPRPCTPDDPDDGRPEGDSDPGGDPDPWPRPPRPARSGEPWTPSEEATVRAMWLAGAPDADADLLLGEIAEEIQRTPGGVHMRLRRIACDPTCPGRALDRPWGDPVTDASGGPATTRPVLTLVPPPPGMGDAPVQVDA